MATKRQMMDDPNSCWNKAADDEHVFLLRSTDKLAAHVVRDWAILAEEAGTSKEKVDEAMEVAAQMELWPTRKVPD